uniref:UAA transporter n=1 Tax=Angiostrongylus cantonensis TaxID=6313 RepID=A0A158P6L9_ANGCA
MNLMTFSTFLFIACQGLIFTSKFLTVHNKIPLRGYTLTVIMFFVVNVVNNQALNFHVPVPLHIIFRSGSLLANLLLSVVLLKKNYTLKKYLSVLAITMGIVICTLATSDLEKESGLSFEEAAKHYREWSIGIAMLIFALLASAYLAICQQRMYENYGKHPEEAMFVTHAVSLPFFAFMGVDIVAAVRKFNASPPLELAGATIPVPSLWMDLLLSCILQYYCIRFVYRLNAEVEALTVTLVVTLRKFLSLVVSIWWFQNPFTCQF